MVKDIFNPMDPRYRCCCGCHVIFGTTIICFLSFFACIFSGVFTALTGATFTEKNPTFMNVAFVFGLVFVLITLVTIILALTNTACGEQIRESVRAKIPETAANHDFTQPLIYLLILNIISFGLSSCFFVIVLRCYQYLFECKNFHNHKRMHSPTAILISK
uniref:Uncharacterized protein n=1 Tax=Panagrolaimus davidi TaxID=227884 RepID=A0A914NY67_9BILA